MKKHIILFTIVNSLLLISCASTPIKEVEIPTSYKITKSEHEPTPVQMDFIGFKSNINLLSVAISNISGDSFLIDLFGGSEKENSQYISDYEYWRDIRDASTLKQFGQILTQNNIALDETSLYYGDFTPQDLAVYNGKNRYVTFVDVIETKMTYHDSGNTQKSWATTGTVTFVTGAAALLSMIDTKYDFKNFSSEEMVTFCLSSGGVAVGIAALIPSLFKPYTTFYFHGKYAICVYDTVQKKLVDKKVIDIDQEDVFTGSFETDNTDKKEIYRYYGQCVANKLVREYEKILQTGF